MASHAKLEKKVAEQEAEIEKLKSGQAGASASGSGGGGGGGSSSADAPPDLLAAAERGDVDGVKAALGRDKAAVNSKNRFGRTP